MHITILNTETHMAVHAPGVRSYVSIYRDNAGCGKGLPAVALVDGKISLGLIKTFHGALPKSLTIAGREKPGCFPRM